MKVQLLEAFAGSDFTWMAGDVVDLPEAEAQRLAGLGAGVLIDEKSQPEIETPEGKQAAKRSKR